MLANFLQASMLNKSERACYFPALLRSLPRDLGAPFRRQVLSALLAAFVPSDFAARLCRRQ
jgi:hypothetical protein